MEEVLNVFGTKKIVENELGNFPVQFLIISGMWTSRWNFMLLFMRKRDGADWVQFAYLTSPVIVEVPDPGLLKKQKIYFDIPEPTAL